MKQQKKMNGRVKHFNGKRDRMVRIEKKPEYATAYS